MACGLCKFLTCEEIEQYTTKKELVFWKIKVTEHIKIQGKPFI